MPAGRSRICGFVNRKILSWGSTSGWGVFRIQDDVKKEIPSDPFLYNNHRRVVLHLVNHSDNPVTVTIKKDSNVTKFGVNQILIAITLASISGISRICRVTAFSGDGLIKAILKLDKATYNFLANDILWQLFHKSRAEWSLLQLC